ncbi:MAG: hypothetical protein RLY93_20725, partial [Sumerlaeia bacterium]
MAEKPLSKLTSVFSLTSPRRRGAILTGSFLVAGCLAASSAMARPLPFLAPQDVTTTFDGPNFV